MSNTPIGSLSAATHAERYPRWVLLSVLLFALALRLPGYTESVWIDELFTSDIFCGEPVVLLKTLYSDVHPPAYFIFMHFWNGVFGDSDVWLRLPALLCGLGSIALIWRLGALLGGPRMGLAAALVLAVSPVHIWYSQEARPYSANIFLLIVCTYAYYRLIERSTFGWMALFLVALTGVVFTHYYMAAFPFVFTALALWRKQPGRWRVLWCSVVVVLLVAIYMAAKSYFSVVPTQMKYLRAFDLVEAWHLLFRWFPTGNSFTPLDGEYRYGRLTLAVVQAVVVALVIRGAWRLLRRANGAHGGDLLIHVSVLPAALLGLTIIGLDKTYIERSALPSLPFFALIVAAGLTDWQSQKLGRSVQVVAATCAVAVLSAYFLRGDHWTVYKPNPDWRGAAAALAQEFDETESGPPLRLYSDYISPTGLSHYDPRIQEVKWFQVDDAKTNRLLTTSAKVFGTEGFPGSWIRRQIQRLVNDLHRQRKALRDGTRMEVYWLPRHDPLASDAPQRFWLIVHRYATPKAQALLDNPAVQIESEQSFSELKLYAIRCKRE